MGVMKFTLFHVHTPLCVGARIDIADEERETALELAQGELADASKPEKRRHYEKVHISIHTITHVHITNDC